MTPSLRSTVLGLVLLALLPPPSRASQESRSAEPEAVWVTMGEDVFDRLARSPEVLSSAFPLQARAARAGVVVTRLPARDLRAVSAFMHAAAGRCSGFIVHDSFGEATAALEGASRGSSGTLATPYVLDQQTLVQQLLPMLDETNILSTIDHLSTFYNNRYYQNTSGEQAALWIRDLWLGYAAGRGDVSVATFPHAGYPQPSVILTIEGTDLASEVVVMGAHLDSIQSGATNTDPATLAPGADDDASGIATLSEVARVLLESGFTPNRTVKIMGYAAEEVGLLGSGDIAESFSTAGTNVVAVLQLDMTAYQGSAEDIHLVGDFTDTDLTAFLGDLVDTYQPAVTWSATACGYACSDHASWTNRGFPAAFPFEARFGQHNLDIHTPDDTVATFGGTAAHALKFARLALPFAVEIGAVTVTVCGDGVREGTEECDGADLGGAACGDFSCTGGTLSCAADCIFDTAACTGCTTCGDGVCELGEDCGSCPADCISEAPVAPGCGNGFCEPGLGEDCLSCAADCRGQQNGNPNNRYCCGGGAGENPVGCADARCTSGGFACSDSLPGGFCCGDLVCEGAEDSARCAVDCGACVPDEPGLELTCTDGLDNDCDGAVDCADADCTGDPACGCQLGGQGDPCSSDAECCSNRCKRNGTCR